MTTLKCFFSMPLKCILQSLSFSVWSRSSHGSQIAFVISLYSLTLCAAVLHPSPPLPPFIVNACFECRPIILPGILHCGLLWYLWLKMYEYYHIIKVSWDTRGGGNNSVRICLQDPVTGYYKICQSANSCLMVFDINYILWYVEWEWFINVDIQTILFKVWKVV